MAHPGRAGTWDWASPTKSSICGWDALCKPGVRAVRSNVSYSGRSLRCFAREAGRRAIAAEYRGEVSRRHIRWVAPPKAGTMNDKGIALKRNGNASDHQHRLAAASPRDEAVPRSSEPPASIPPQALLARVLQRENLQRALKQVRRNQGAPGIDGMTVEALPHYLKDHWPRIRAQPLTGTVRPQPVKRVETTKSDGKVRCLGIPTAVDRFIQQAIAQVLSAQWELTSVRVAKLAYRPLNKSILPVSTFSLTALLRVAILCRVFSSLGDPHRARYRCFYFFPWPGACAVPLDE